LEAAKFLLWFVFMDGCQMGVFSGLCRGKAEWKIQKTNQYRKNVNKY
jgi:hypothetical protein